MQQKAQLPEPILEENADRFVLFPIEHDDIWKFYKKAEASFWTAEEIDLSTDLKDWGNLNDFSKYLATFCMLLGRLEIFTVIVIFSKSFWTKS